MFDQGQAVAAGFPEGHNLEELLGGRIGGKASFDRPESQVILVGQKCRHAGVAQFQQLGLQFFPAHDPFIGLQGGIVEFGDLLIVSQGFERRVTLRGLLIALNRLAGQHPFGVGVEGAFGGDEVFVADFIGGKSCGGQHQRITALAVRQAQAPSLPVVQVDGLGAAFAQIKVVLRLIMGSAPPGLLVFLFERWRVRYPPSPCIADRCRMGGAAEPVPGQVDTVLAARVIGLAFVLITDRLQRER
ncbi:hypothetical protein D3C85_922210 [compost metagenome]